MVEVMSTKVNSLLETASTREFSAIKSDNEDEHSDTEQVPVTSTKKSSQRRRYQRKSESIENDALATPKSVGSVYRTRSQGPALKYDSAMLLSASSSKRMVRDILPDPDDVGNAKSAYSKSSQKGPSSVMKKSRSDASEADKSSRRITRSQRASASGPR